MCNTASKVIISIILIYTFSFILSSCSHTGSQFYKDTDYPLTNDTAFSKNTSLRLLIPAGGWTTADNRELKSADIWLIRNDFSAMIDLFVFNPSQVLLQHPGEDTLEVAFGFSKDIRKAKLKEKFRQVQEDEFFTLGNNRFGAYEYEGDEQMPVRVVVFRYKDNFFELAAIPSSKIGQRPVDTKELFRIQQTLLTSIR